VIVDGVSLDVGRGEFVTLIGPNGAGKTTLFNLLSGLYRPSAGSIALDGRDVTTWPPPRRARAGLGRSFQTARVFPGLTVFENARVAAQARGGGNLAVWRRASADRNKSERAHAALERTGLAGRAAARHAGALGQGDARKLEIAMLLAAGFDTLLLDEPTAGVGMEEIPPLLEVIAAVHRRDGKTVLMVEHRMDVIGGLSDRIAVMHHGRLLTVAPPAAVMVDRVVQEAYLGDAL
jgi:branched-chain amino acid transport system ATP-binding protein